MAERIVVALGGNALGSTPEKQLELVQNTAGVIADLVEQGYEVVIGHGNGPQVGMINLAMEFSGPRAISAITCSRRSAARCAKRGSKRAAPP